MIFHETSPWISMKDSTWSALTAGKKPVAYPKNRMVLCAGDQTGCVYIVSNGRIRVVSYQNQGEEKHLYIAEKNAMFGESGCLMGRDCVYSAVAIVDSMLYVVPWEETQEVMKRDWQLTQEVLQLLCRKKAVLLEQIIELSFSCSLQRVAQTLLNVSREYGVREAGKIAISIRFTHQDVANLVNTSRVTVNQIFRLLIERGIILRREGYYSIADEATLIEVASGRIVRL